MSFYGVHYMWHYVFYYAILCYIICGITCYIMVYYAILYIMFYLYCMLLYTIPHQHIYILLLWQSIAWLSLTSQGSMFFCRFSFWFCTECCYLQRSCRCNLVHGERLHFKYGLGDNIPLSGFWIDPVIMGPSSATTPLIHPYLNSNIRQQQMGFCVWSVCEISLKSPPVLDTW